MWLNEAQKLINKEAAKNKCLQIDLDMMNINEL